jgi:hypothetical protein
VRKVLGRVALLLGVILVGAAGWWGAVTLFDDGDDGGAHDRTTISGCEASTTRQARAAMREFERIYLKRDHPRWFTGVGVSRTDVLDQIDTSTQVSGNGRFLIVRTREGAKAPDLPACLEDVPIVVIVGGPFRSD